MRREDRSGEFVAGAHQGHLGHGALGCGTIMLCRTANELYWMARHQAPRTSRLLDVTNRMSLLPTNWSSRARLAEPGGPTDSGLDGVLPALHSFGRECIAFHDSRCGNTIIDLLLSACCARVRVQCGDDLGNVRGLNSSWLGSVQILIASGATSELLEWVKMRSHLFRGRDLRHDAARRGVSLHPGHAHRARRQHSPHFDVKYQRCCLGRGRGRCVDTP